MAKISFRSAENQAEFAVRYLGVASIAMQRSYEQSLKGCVEFLQENRMGDLRHLNTEKATAYLEARSQEFGQKTLDLDRQAIQAFLGEKLPLIKSEMESAQHSRAYTPEQVRLVSDAQSIKHRLSTLIAENAGLMAHELFTLLPVEERAAFIDTHREYREDRFVGREDINIYTVYSKGGLCREVAIDRNLSEKLEERRLDTVRTVYDREICFQQAYDIGGGKQWSDSFSKASERELGWSVGGYGLRHEFAQNRVNTLQRHGYSYRVALEVVSQEMGNFRPEATEVYLR